VKLDANMEDVSYWRGQPCSWFLEWGKDACETQPSRKKRKTNLAAVDTVTDEDICQILALCWLWFTPLVLAKRPLSWEISWCDIRTQGPRLCRSRPPSP